MSKIIYKAFETKIDSEEKGILVTYGIRAFDGKECIASFEDVCPNQKQIEELALRCTFLELDPVQLGDVVEDFLTGIAV